MTTSGATEVRKAADANKALFDLYKRHWAALGKALRAQNPVQLEISYPLLLHASPDYYRTDIKLLAVGQETRGWGFDNLGEIWGTYPWHNMTNKTIDNLMKVYKSFHRGRDYQFRRAFLEPVNTLYRRLNPDGPPYGFLWSNLIKVNQAKHRPQDSIEHAVCTAFPVLPFEIQVVNPDVVVFFTGPNYQERLESTYPGIQLKAVPGFGPKQRYRDTILAEVIHKNLLMLAFRTYHPNYFNQSGERDEFERVIDEIVCIVQGK